jgi:hypothetical protein
MRTLRLALTAAAVAAPVLMAAVSPANALCIRKCTAILSSGACSAHETVCEPVEASVAKKLKPLRDGMRCRTQALLCDYTGCKPVCGALPKKKS